MSLFDYILIWTLYLLIQRYILCPIIYWSGAVLDEFNSSVFDEHKWWFNEYTSKTLKEFYNYRKTTEGYDMYRTGRWFPVLGLFAVLLYFVGIFLSSIFYLIALFLFEISPFILKFIDKTRPLCNFIKTFTCKILSFFRTNVLINFIRTYYNKMVDYIINIKLA